MHAATRPARAAVLAAASPLALVLSATALAAPAQAAQPAHGGHPSGAAATCPPSARAVGYSDALDGAVVGGATVGGLSGLARDRRTGSFLAVVDNDADRPARVYDLGPDPLAPAVAAPPLVLRRPDGTPWTGADADDEGLAVLPGGDLLVSSETEPSVRRYDRHGVQRADLEVPDRFRVAPAGEATANATLEGLAVSPSGRTVVAAVEGALSGDAPAGGGEALDRRFLVWSRDRAAAGGYRLVKQVAYRVEPGQRVPEVAFYGEDRLLVEEASYSPATGNAVSLYAVTGLAAAPDVSGVADLAAAPAGTALAKVLVADLAACPDLGATAKGVQANPLLDNFEGMAVDRVRPDHRDDGHHDGHGGGVRARVTLVSDDNFNPEQQTTRLLVLDARLP